MICGSFDLDVLFIAVCLVFLCGLIALRVGVCLLLLVV